jgi:hypothetical protein
MAYVHVTGRHGRDPDRAGARAPGGRGDSRFRPQSLPLHERRSVMDRSLGDASCYPGPEVGSREHRSACGTVQLANQAARLPGTIHFIHPRSNDIM